MLVCTIPHMSSSTVKSTLKSIDQYFARSQVPQENVLYKFFKKEIKSTDIKITHLDISIIGTSRKKRKYACALWRIPNYHKTIPWVRIGISEYTRSPSLELVLPVFHGDMPEFWSKGKNYFRLGIKYVIGKHGMTIQMFTNPIDVKDTSEILSIMTIFHRKITSHSTNR